MDDIFRRSPAIVSRRIQGEAVLVPIRQKAGNLDAIYALKESAALVWSLLDGKLTVRQVLAGITVEFEVDETQAGADLLNLLADLSAVGAIEKG